MVEATVSYLFSAGDGTDLNHAVWTGLLGDSTDAAAREAIATERRGQANILIVSMEYSPVAIGAGPDRGAAR